MADESQSTEQQRAARKIAVEIARNGPLPFHRFMRIALYDEECGYYRAMPDPFGKAGDFYTAAQLQPVYGRLVRRWMKAMEAEMNAPRDFTVVELGAGRGEMAAAFAEFRYVPVEVGRGELPEAFEGAVFMNEFFDALPVDVLERHSGEWFERLVDIDASGAGEGFRWVRGGAASGELLDYARRHAPGGEEGLVIEACLDARRWSNRLGASLRRGFLVVVDYGYRSKALGNYPWGTLMSYRRHRATEDVLSEAGTRDITAHVNFTALEEWLIEAGFTVRRFESLGSALLSAGEGDEFRGVLEAEDEREAMRLRLQLKTLLFSFGESFHAMVAEKNV